jgi:hypothetical protein
VARTAGRRRPRRTSGDVARRRRPRGHLRRHLRSRNLSPCPSPNSLGSHRNQSARPPRRPNRRRRIGSPRPRRDSGYPLVHREATGSRPRCRIRRVRTVPPANTSAGDAQQSRRPPVRRPSRRPPVRRLSRPCSRRPPTAAVTRHHPRPSIRDAPRRRQRWQRNPVAPRHTPNLSPSRRRRRGDTVVRRTPAGSRLPTCSRGFRPPRREAAVAGAAKSEIGSYRPSGTRNAGPERTNF